MRYPIGLLGCVCLWTLMGAYGCYVSMSALNWLLYGALCVLFFKFHRIGMLSKRFWVPFAISCVVMGWMVHECATMPTHGVYQRGLFRFEKLFRTQPHRVGGFGQLQLADGRRLRVYIHAPFKKEMVFNDTDVYRFSGYVQPLRPPFKSSQNFSFYLWARAIRWHTKRVRLSAVEPQPAHPLLQRCRQTLFDALETHDPTLSHIYRAIVMGKKEQLSKEQQQHFFYTGTMHLFAVSGLHVGVVSAFLFFIGRLLCFPFWLRWIVTGGGVLLYASIVGLSPSTLRATLMVGFVLLAQLFRRPIHSRNAFFNAFGLTLLFNPFELWDVGFQLSYGTVASILCVGVPLSRWCCNRYPMKSVWPATVIVSFCASAMSSLFSIYYWNVFMPWAFVANLFLIPLASGIVVLGMVAWAVHVVCPWMAPLVEWIACGCMTLLLKSVAYLERLPLAVCHVSLSPQWLAVCLVLFACGAAYADRRTTAVHP